jgi:tetratricopeptide (TPR) repeat protein
VTHPDDVLTSADEVAVLQARLEAHPRDVVAWRRLAGTLSAAGDGAGAILAATHAISLEPRSAPGYLQRARLLQVERNYRLMAVDAERAVALAPDDPAALTMLAFGTWLADHDFGRARELWRRARLVAPGHVAVARLGRTLRVAHRRGLVLALGPAVAAGLFTMVGGALVLQPHAPQAFWMAGLAGVFLLLTLVVTVVARLRLPLQVTGPGVLAGSVVAAALLAGGSGFLAVGTLRAALALELMTALLGTVFAIRPVRLWMRRRPANARRSVV